MVKKYVCSHQCVYFGSDYLLVTMDLFSICEIDENFQKVKIIFRPLLLYFGFYEEECKMKTINFGHFMAFLNELRTSIST